MKKILLSPLLAALLLFAGAADSGANVVRPAPNFGWDGPRGLNSLRSVKGQPVVLLIARDSRVRALRKQIKELKSIYHEFAARKVIFAAAIVNGPQEVRSDIPFALTSNPGQVAVEYGVKDRFCIVIIGPDGNVDYQTSEVVPAPRVRDVLANTFESQAPQRK